MDNKKLTAALEKKAVYGNDIDLSSYSDSDKGSLKSVDDLSEATRGRLEYVGIETGAAEEESRSASFVQLDNNAVEIKVKKTNSAGTDEHRQSCRKISGAGGKILVEGRAARYR